MVTLLLVAARRVDSLQPSKEMPGLISMGLKDGELHFPRVLGS